MTTDKREMKDEMKTKEECNHHFVDRITNDIRWSAYGRQNMPSKRIIIYCENCGKVAQDKNTFCLD